MENSGLDSDARDDTPKAAVKKDTKSLDLTKLNSLSDIEHHLVP
jgi:hypothetical protein